MLLKFCHKIWSKACVFTHFSVKNFYLSKKQLFWPKLGNFQLGNFNIFYTSIKSLMDTYKKTWNQYQKFLFHFALILRGTPYVHAPPLDYLLVKQIEVLKSLSKVTWVIFLKPFLGAKTLVSHGKVRHVIRDFLQSVALQKWVFSETLLPSATLLF